METTRKPLEESWELTDLFADDEAFERAKEKFRDGTLSRVSTGTGATSLRIGGDALRMRWKSDSGAVRTIAIIALLRRAQVGPGSSGSRPTRQCDRRSNFSRTDLSRRVRRSCAPRSWPGRSDRIEQFIEQEPRLRTLRSIS